MNIRYCTPFSIEKNLGKAYNEYVDKLTKYQDDWVFFIDGDCMFLDPFWGKQIHDLVHKYPETGIFTCYTNRVGDLQQCYEGIRSNNSNILDHYQIAQDLKQNKYWETKEINRVISGHFFGFSRKTWLDVNGFDETSDKILRVDNRFSSKILQSGKKILLIEGLYIFHLYRIWSQHPKKDKNHLL
jgi:GT2 family glycosyltransferase